MRAKPQSVAACVKALRRALLSQQPDLAAQLRRAKATILQLRGVIRADAKELRDTRAWREQWERAQHEAANHLAVSQ